MRLNGLQSLPLEVKPEEYFREERHGQVKL